MALRGTLKDFGIADIFQLIGHQTKSGVLKLKSRDSEVSISFKEGSVVKADSSTRQRKDLLGHMMVRAGLLEESKLTEALDIQKRTLKRLGDVLVGMDLIKKNQLTEFMRLQTTETIYRLFSWQSGTYEFEQSDVERDPDFGEPIRAESVLMEGFRMVDEWPMIRKRISGYGMTFETAQPLPDKKGGDDFDFDLEGGSSSSKDDPVSESERRVFSLINSKRDVQMLIDLSRLGEFETCKALLTLLDRGNVRIAGSEKKSLRPPLLAGGLLANKHQRPIAGTIIAAIILTAGLVGLIRSTRMMPGLTQSASGIPDTTKLAWSLMQQKRIEGALEARRTASGHYPDSLEQLTAEGWLEEGDLTHPPGIRYKYEKNADTWVVIPHVASAE